MFDVHALKEDGLLRQLETMQIKRVGHSSAATLTLILFPISMRAHVSANVFDIRSNSPLSNALFSSRQLIYIMYDEGGGKPVAGTCIIHA